MGRKFISLEGKKFGRLTVIKRVEDNSKGMTQYLCECDCENKTKKIILWQSLKSGNTKSCGCLQKEATIKFNLNTNGKYKSTHKHKLSKTRIYKIHSSMKQRCYNPNDENYHHYGGRNIRICDEWIGDDGFINFYNWSMENGYTEKLTIERIDVNGNYDPNNCKWATKKEQANNRTNTTYITFRGVTKTTLEWSIEKNIPLKTLNYRLRKNWSTEDLFLPLIKLDSGKKSGVKGVAWIKAAKKWRVKFVFEGEYVYLGHFKELEDAIKTKEEYISNKNTDKKGD